jgi:hypothetical protein
MTLPFHACAAFVTVVPLVAPVSGRAPDSGLETVGDLRRGEWRTLDVTPVPRRRDQLTVALADRVPSGRDSFHRQQHPEDRPVRPRVRRARQEDCCITIWRF